MRHAFIVFAALVILAALVCGIVFFVLDKPGSGPHKWGKAKAEMGEIQKALNLRALQDHRYPSSLDALKNDYFCNGVPNDPFTHKPYDYVSTGDRFFLVCYGRDEQPGGVEPPDADIVYMEGGCLTP